VSQLGNRRGPKPTLTRRAIGQAVLEVGFPDASLSAVGAHLGVAHSTLYRYVDDVADLVTAGVEVVAAGVPPQPTGPDWRTVCEAAFWSQWEVCTEHPGLAAALTRYPRAGRPLFARADDLGRALAGLGFAAELAVLVADTLLDVVRDAVAMSARTTNDPEVIRTALDRRLPDAADRPARVVVEKALTQDPRWWLGRKLQLVLAGAAALAGGE